MNTRTIYSRIGIPAILILCFMSLPATSSSQELPSFAPCQAGTTYIISFPDTVQNRIDPKFPPTLKDKTQLLMYATTNTNVTVTTGSGSTTKSLNGGEFTTYDVLDSPFTTQTNTPNDMTIRVEADNPIVVYCYFVTRFGGEAFTAIPVEAWGTDYVLASSPGETVRDVTPTPLTPSMAKVPAPEEALILAAFDNTTITIVPTGTLLGLAKPIDITLNANQAYLVQSFIDTSGGAAATSIAGSRIIADKPIGVISGNTRAQVTDQEGITRNSFKNAMIEWLPPTDQHGTKFVYLPTWDNNRKTGDPNDNVDQKRQAEYIRIYNTSDGGKNSGSYTGEHDFTIPASNSGEGDNYYIQRQEDPVPIYFETEAPALGMMNSSGVAKFNGTVTYEGDLIGASYDARGGSYMVEMTPREQWVGFAPFLAPDSPPNMNHYINVVTDSLSMNKVVYRAGPSGEGSEQKFIFQRGAIPGSDLVWGTMQLVSGTSYYLRGLDSNVRFYGFVYGMLPGYELFRPFNPSEYEENIAIAYGYPLAPSRCVLSGNGSPSDVPADVNLSGFSLGSIGPNPFMRRTTIEFSLSHATPTRVEIFDADGRSVATLADGTLTSGRHIIEWDAAGHPAGLYYCRVASGTSNATVPLLLLK